MMLDKHRKIRKPIFFRLRGTIIKKIWWQILLVVLYTAGVISLHTFVPQLKMDFPLSLIPVLGIVIGLLLVFRTNTAYDRYWEGRRIWSTMTVNIRSLTRCIWLGVQETQATKSKDIVEKVSAINLLVAFVYATKNYLRHDYAYDSEEIKDLVAHIQHFSTPSSNQPLAQQEEIAIKVEAEAAEAEENESRKSGKNSASAKNNSPPNEDGSTADLENQNGSTGGGILGGGGKFMQNNVNPQDDYDSSCECQMNNYPRGNGRGRRSKILTPHDAVTPTNIPIELSYYIGAYINHVRGKALADSFAISEMNHALNSLVECLTGFERILRTPIPLAYSVHLHHSVYIYILSLPYQLAGQLGWWTIPSMAIASFALLGILGIGWEIENPFGLDENDLPLDDFCNVIRKEIQVIVAHAILPLETWLLSPLNKPFMPVTSLSAPELIVRPPEEIRSTLRKALPQCGIYEENLMEERDYFHIRLGNLQFMKHPHMNIHRDGAEMKTGTGKF